MRCLIEVWVYAEYPHSLGDGESGGTVGAGVSVRWVWVKVTVGVGDSGIECMPTTAGAWRGWRVHEEGGGCMKRVAGAWVWVMKRGWRVHEEGRCEYMKRVAGA